MFSWFEALTSRLPSSVPAWCPPRAQLCSQVQPDPPVCREVALAYFPFGRRDLREERSISVHPGGAVRRKTNWFVACGGGSSRPPSITQVGETCCLKHPSAAGSHCALSWCRCSWHGRCVARRAPSQGQPCRRASRRDVVAESHRKLRSDRSTVIDYTSSGPGCPYPAPSRDGHDHGGKQTTEPIRRECSFSITRLPVVSDTKDFSAVASTCLSGRTLSCRRFPTAAGP